MKCDVDIRKDLYGNIVLSGWVLSITLCARDVYVFRLFGSMILEMFPL
jgi:hypothetical protein